MVNASIYPQPTVRLRGVPSFAPLPICPSALMLLALLARDVACPRLHMVPLTRGAQPSPAPSPPTSYSIQFVVYATVTSVGAQRSAEKKRVWTNAMAPPSHPSHFPSHRHSHHHMKKRRRQNTAPRADDRTVRLVAQLIEELKQTEEKQGGKQQREMAAQYQYHTKTNSSTDPSGIGTTELITWQLFSQCSRAFVQVRTDNAKVDARGGTGDPDAECQTLFLPESVSGERAARGLLRLVHVRSGRLLCLGRRRGVIARKRNLRSLRDPLCWLREGLTPSGYTSLSATRPIGFSRAGRAVTHASRVWDGAGRCFHFAKLISRRRVEEHQRQRRCPPLSTIGTATARRTRAGDDHALREMARRTLLAKIEAREEEDGSGTEGDEPPFTIPISI